MTRPRPRYISALTFSKRLLCPLTLNQTQTNAQRLRFSRLRVGKVSLILRQLRQQEVVEKPGGSNSAATTPTRGGYSPTAETGRLI
ncbi:MAG: hypothetical protein DPW09_30015 [Anaerolineae bacterium]|nr:hypothetical protein [Anaerolineales bacterium]MCQ3977685.1 hypothetical protein [Anaerolineae bacterium]